MTRTASIQFCQALGHRLRARRLFLELTQEQIAKLIGLNVQQFRKYEMGTSEPLASTVLKLARALECSADFMLGRNEKVAMRETEQLLADRAVAAILRRLKSMDARQRKRAMLILPTGEDSQT